MNPDALREQIELFDTEAPIARAYTPPSSWYVDPAFYELERRSVFRGSWQPVARVAQLTEPGSYVAGCFAGQPWVVVRGQDEEIRGFHNVCRHKGREVVVGEGRANKLVCSYHAWSYELDGRLAKAPRMAGIEQFDRAAMSLTPLRTEQWGPWVFINRDDGAGDLSLRLAPLTKRLDESGWSGLRYLDRKVWDIGCNWKVYADNYLDGGYHIPHMHPTLDAQLDMDSYRTELFDSLSIQTSDASSVSDERIDYDAKERIGAGAIYAWIYPNLMLNRYGPVLDSNYIVPVGPDRCHVVYEFYFDPTAADDPEKFCRDSVAQSDVTQREDIEICESVQTGLGSEAYDRGRYAPRVEIGEYHFHGLLARDYQRALG